MNAPIGHNKPPSDVEYLGENLTLRHVGLIRLAEEHMAMAENIPPEFKEEVEATFTADFIKKVQACFKELERARALEKEPFLRQGQFVDTFFGDLKKKLQATENKAIAPLNNWLQKKAHEEQQRREAEAEAMRKESAAAIKELAEAPRAELPKAIEHAATMTNVAEIATKAAEAPITTLAKTTGKFSSAGLRKKWVGAIADVETLDLGKLRPHFTEAELQKALERFVKAGGRQCEGAKITEEIETKVK